MRFSLDTRPNPVTPTAHSRNHRTVLISKKQTSNLHSIRGYHNRNLCLHSALLARFHYFQNHEFTRTEKGLWGEGGVDGIWKGFEALSIISKIRGNGSGEVNRASFIGDVEWVARGGGAIPFPTPPPSWPCRHPFHRSRRWQSSPSSTIWRFPLDLTAR